MSWLERAVAALGGALFLLAFALGVPAESAVAPVVSRTPHAVGQGQMATAYEDPYRPVSGSPEQVTALGRRYLAAVQPGNSAVFKQVAAAATGSWPKYRAACQASIGAKQQTLALIRQGQPAWPQDLQPDIDALIGDVQNDIAAAQACAEAAKPEDMKDTPDVVDSGAADRIRVRLGLSPRPSV